MTKGFAVVRDEAAGLTVSYEDFHVEAFDGMNYEVTYKLNPGNRDRLRAALEADGYRGALRDMIREHFGSYLDQDSFALYCSRHGIQYQSFTWLS